MTDAEKKLLQAKHRMEEAQARDRVKERKAPDTAADSGRCDFGKGDAKGAGDGVVRPRNLSLAEAGNDPILYAGGPPGNRGLSFFVPEGRTYSPPAKAGGGSPPVGRARALSEGGIASPAGAAGQGCIIYKLPALPTQSAQGLPFWNPCSWGGNIPPHPAACLRKPATGSFVADTGAEQFDSTPVWLGVVIHDALFEKRGEQLQYPFRKDKVIYGDLSFGGQDGQPGRGTLRRGRCGLSELFPDTQRLRWGAA